MSQMSQDNPAFRDPAVKDNAGFGERLVEAGEKAASFADDATRKAGNAAASLAEGAGALASEAGAMATAARDKAAEKASDLEALVSAEIKAHPLRTLAFAAAAGAVLGFFAGR